MSSPTQDVPGTLIAGQLEEESEAENGALILHGSAMAASSGSSSDDSDSDSDSDRAPPTEIGEVDPAKCKATGPGFSGSGACAPVSLYLYAHDHYGRRLQKGGDEVVVRVSPASSSMAGAPIEATVCLACVMHGIYPCNHGTMHGACPHGACPCDHAWHLPMRSWYHAWCLPM